MEIPLPQNVKSRKISFYTYKFSSTLNVRWRGDEIDRKQPPWNSVNPTKFWVNCLKDRVRAHIVSSCNAFHGIEFSHCVVPENIHTPPPPRKIIGNSEGEGGFKGSNFRGVGGFMGNYFLEGDGPRTKHWKQCTIDLKHKKMPTYVVLKQKSVLLAIEMRLTSLASMLLYFFEWASATISRRTMCL